MGSTGTHHSASGGRPLSSSPRERQVAERPLVVLGVERARASREPIALRTAPFSPAHRARTTTKNGWHQQAKLSDTRMDTRVRARALRAVRTPAGRERRRGSGYSEVKRIGGFPAPSCSAVLRVSNARHLRNRSREGAFQAKGRAGRSRVMRAASAIKNS